MKNKNYVLPSVTSMRDISVFMELIAQEIDTFHPLTDFSSYSQPESHFRLYSDEDANERNRLLDECIKICLKANLDPTILIVVYNAKRAIKQ